MILDVWCGRVSAPTLVPSQHGWVAMVTHRVAAGPVEHVVIFVQENHTTDNYFASMGAYGANVAAGGPSAVNPPKADQPHDRAAYYR